ncbi:FTR1 family protein [Shinella sp. S4-D37]|uniref:FTR1 family protein n=1 Tax=Shinella sp. S4-D37 TaxID=3161999 RepID=UPI003466923D
MIAPALRALLLALAALFAVLGPAVGAEAPWRDAEALRGESAQIQRRLFRTPDTALRADVAARLERVRRLWEERLRAAYAQAVPSAVPSMDEAVEAFADAAGRWDSAASAAAGARLWTRLLDGAFRAGLARLDAGEAAAAAGWLNIREYARTSRDTAASIALRETLAGRMTPAEARRVIETELLGVYAGELRKAVAEARGHRAAGYGIQLAGALARAGGLHALLSESLAARLGAQPAGRIAQAFARLAPPDRLEGADLEALLADIETRLATYAPASLSPEDLDRRVRLLARFVALVPVEYGKGVRDGEIVIPFEYFEAGLFRDRAAMLFGDLGYDLAARAPQSFDRLSAILKEMKALIADRGDGARVESLAQEAAGLVAAAYGSDLSQGGYAAALSLLPDILDEVRLAAEGGDWEEAELKRLEAYALFDPDIEQRLMPRAPALALRMEADFWEGSVENPGLGRILADRGPDGALRSAVDRMKTATGEAGRILDTKLSGTGAFLQSLAILLREGLEAVLVLACMIGALKASGLPARGAGGWRLPVAGGVLAALGGSFALWLAVGRLFTLGTLQRELLEGLSALAAAAVLLYVTHWMFRKSYVGDWIGEIRRKAAVAAKGRDGGYLGWLTLFSLSFLVVFREGFETVLFYEALLIDAPALPVLGGLAAGGVLAVAVGFAMLGLEAKLPIAAFFRLTGGLLAVLCVMLVGSGVRGLQTAALVSATPVAWFPAQPWLQLHFGLYPVAEALLAQSVVAGFLIVSLLLRLVKRRRKHLHLAVRRD